jgi:DNA-binding NtrC family response regulator
MLELFELLERLARTEATLLIEGETGTGKDVLAEAVHQASARASGPFVVLDCGAAAPSLLETELFGHERGAFTGAVAARSGVFEQAHGGTLFLDELGELPLELQPKLLRALEKRQVRRLGSQRVVDVDVRVIAATNRQLLRQVGLGKFRADLYYRLETTKVTVPALRERKQDIPFLVRSFAEALGERDLGERLPQAVWTKLLDHDWPGNVRELRNAVQRLLLMPCQPIQLMTPLTRAGSAAPESRSDGLARSPRQAALDGATVLPLPHARRNAMRSFERDYLMSVMEIAGGNVTRAAGLAGVSRQMMTRLLKNHRLRRANESSTSWGAAPARQDMSVLARTDHEPPKQA